MRLAEWDCLAEAKCRIIDFMNNTSRFQTGNGAGRKIETSGMKTKKEHPWRKTIPCVVCKKKPNMMLYRDQPLCSSCHQRLIGKNNLGKNKFKEGEI